MKAGRTAGEQSLTNRSLTVAARNRAAYIALLAAVFLVAVWASYSFGAQIDNYSYDKMFRLYNPPPWKPESIILAIDDDTLNSIDRGMENIRPALARGLRLINAAEPRAVAVDLILSDRRDEAADAALSEAFRATPHLVLSSTLLDDPPGWQDPRPEFARWAGALGHVYAKPDDEDSVTRVIPLDRHVGREQRWAIALEAFRLSRGGGTPLESPGDVEVAGTLIPFKRTDEGRLLRIRYLPPDRSITRVSLHRLLDHPGEAARFTGKVVFVGVTAATAVRDRLFTPYSYGATTTGIEIHAEAFETIAQRLFLTDVPLSWPPFFSLLLVAAQGAAAKPGDGQAGGRLHQPAGGAGREQPVLAQDRHVVGHPLEQVLLSAVVGDEDDVLGGGHGDDAAVGHAASSRGHSFFRHSRGNARGRWPPAARGREPRNGRSSTAPPARRGGTPRRIIP